MDPQIAQIFADSHTENAHGWTVAALAFRDAMMLRNLFTFPSGNLRTSAKSADLSNCR
jgi:hypothetical protein